MWDKRPVSQKQLQVENSFKYALKNWLLNNL